MTSPLERWNRLDGKVVMVTGASSGIGKEFCTDLAKAGCRIIAAARRIDRLQSLCQEINHMAEPGGRAAAVELDVSGDGTVIDVAVRKAWEVFGRIDALINSAGVRGTIKSPLELEEDEWDNTYRTNVRGSWLVTKYVCLQMCASNIRGSIINISSISGTHRGQAPGGVAYDSSKAALNTMTKVMAMAIEFGGKGIRVNSISPGLFKSEITEGLMQKDWLQNVALRTSPLRTFGTSDPALTSLVRYLIDDSSEYVSGNVFIVDAGGSLPGVPIFSSL